MWNLLHVSDEAHAFIKARDLLGEFTAAIDMIHGMFLQICSVIVSLQDDPECSHAQPILVVSVITRMGSAASLEARRLLFSTLRERGCDKLCSYLACLIDHPDDWAEISIVTTPADRMWK